MTPLCPKCSKPLDEILYTSSVDGEQWCLLTWDAEHRRWRHKQESWSFDADNVFETDMQCPLCDTSLPFDADSHEVALDLDELSREEIASLGIPDETVMEIKL